MRKSVLYCIVFLLLFSCGEELIPKPDNLISKEKMANIIQEMAIVNAAKTTNATVFNQNDIEPTQYVLSKFEVDSLQFVQSDRYYVSNPVEYEKIFKLVEERLETEAKKLGAEKRQKDSIRTRKQRNAALKQEKQRKVKSDSLP